MRQWLILLEAGEEGSPAPGMMRGAIALQQAILTQSSHCTIHVLSSDEGSLPVLGPSSDVCICPLTFDIPPALDFPARLLYQRCGDVASLRQQVQGWGYRTGNGSLWLPVVLTARGPLYAEAIAGEATPHGLQYHQPLHLSDRQRQPVYRLAQRLLRAIAAPPATYLMQFGWQGDQVVFDRLFPFPAAPAIASLGVQTPDLFACHGWCLTGQPLRDLVIPPLPRYHQWQAGAWVEVEGFR